VRDGGMEAEGSARTACVPQFPLPSVCDDSMCGRLEDDCGNKLHCPDHCQAPDTCGGGGYANICGCWVAGPEEVCQNVECGYAYVAHCGILYPCGTGDVRSCKTSCRRVWKEICPDPLLAYQCNDGTYPMGCTPADDAGTGTYCCELM